MNRAVLYTATRKLYQDMVVSMKSLLHHTNVDKVYCFIEDDSFPYELPEFVETINITKQEWLHPKGANMDNLYSYIVLMRAIAFKFIPEDKVLSLDCDTIVRKDVSALFDESIGDNYYAAVQEDHTNLRTVWPYFNFGVAILNLKEIKKHERLLIDLLNEAKFGCPEQDIMLLMFRDKIASLKSKFNSTYCTPKCNEEDIAIRHYVGHEKKELLYKSDEYRMYLYMPWEEVLK